MWDPSTIAHFLRSWALCATRREIGRLGLMNFARSERAVAGGKRPPSTWWVLRLRGEAGFNHTGQGSQGSFFPTVRSMYGAQSRGGGL